MLFLLIRLNFSRSLYFIYSYKVVPLRTEGQHYSRKTWLPSDTDQGSLNESMRVKRHILLKRSFKPLKINPACFRSSSQNDSVNDTCSPHTALCNPFFFVSLVLQVGQRVQSTWTTTSLWCVSGSWWAWHTLPLCSV